MTLTTHAIAGAAAAKLIPQHPVLGFFAGFVSHFVFDAIPHGHYKLFSKKYDEAHPLEENMDTRSRAFILDLLRVGFDAIIGLAIALVLFNPLNSFSWTIAAGALGGILPDPLQFAYFKIRREPLTSLQRFHLWIHAKKRFDGQIIKSILIEAGIAAAIIFLVFTLTSGRG